MIFYLVTLTTKSLVFLLNIVTKIEMIWSSKKCPNYSPNKFEVQVHNYKREKKVMSSLKT